MAKMVGIRDRVAHMYGSLDLERLWNELSGGLATFEEFGAPIAVFIGPR